MRSISAGERTGNIWWNREARAALGVAGGSSAVMERVYRVALAVGRNVEMKIEIGGRLVQQRPGGL
jgi:hypothetical protein